MSLATDTAEIVGEYRSPHNAAQSSKGSIHDDATASKLGFKGGTVAGSIHMDQFAPVVQQLYGDDARELLEEGEHSGSNAAQQPAEPSKTQQRYAFALDPAHSA